MMEGSFRIARNEVLPSSTVNQVCDAQQIQFTFRIRLQLPYPEYREKEGEHISEGKSLFSQSCLHGWGANFRSEFQSSVWSEEVLMTSENIQLLV